jgi:hypothetical protein
MNYATKATAHENMIRRVANFYSAAENRSRGALWPSFAPARIHEGTPQGLCLFVDRRSHMKPLNLHEGVSHRHQT